MSGSGAKDYFSTRVYDGVREVSPEEADHYCEEVDRVFREMEKGDFMKQPSTPESTADTADSDPKV